MSETFTDAPVCRRGGAAHWPAMTRWSLPYLSRLFQEEQLLLTTDLAASAPVRKMAFPKYCSYVSRSGVAGQRGQPFYATYFQPLASEKLAGDWQLPGYENLFLDLPSEVVTQYLRRFGWLLLSPRDGKASRHTDLFATYAWLAVIWGRKHVLVWSPQDAEGAPLMECWLEAGDLLYIPPLYPHQIVNVEPTLAVTLNGIRRHQVPQLRAAAVADYAGWRRRWQLAGQQSLVDSHFGIAAETGLH